MEQSLKPVSPTPPYPIGDSGLVEDQPKREPTAPAKQFIRLEKNLAQLGFFTPSTKKIKSVKEKVTTVIHTVDGKKIEARATIIPSAKYGLPITADQDTLLAILKIATDLRQELGEVKNPITFTSAELFRIQGKSASSGKHYKELPEQLLRIKHTGINSEGAVYVSGKKTWVTDAFSVLDRVVIFGQELDDGTIAAKNYIWFAEWLLSNINSNHVLPLDYDTYKKLTTHIAKALAPLLQVWLFASINDGRFEKRYDELCQLLNIRQYRYPSVIKQTIGPSLDEFVTHGVLSQWKLEKTADQNNFKVLFYHGDKFHSHGRKKLAAAEPGQLPAAETMTRSHRPRQRRLSLKHEAEPHAQPTIIDYRIISELTKRGVGETDARDLLAKLKPGQPIVETLEWGDLQIENSRGKITNPPGFYISLLKRNVIPPPTFESSRAKNSRLEAEKEQQRATQKATATREAEEAAKRQETEAAIDRLETSDPERYRLLYDQAKANLFSSPVMAGKQNEPASWHEGAIRIRMLKLFPEILHQATKDPTRQGDRLHDVFNLEMILTTPQLPAPVEQAAVSPTPAASQPEERPTAAVDTHLL